MMMALQICSLLSLNSIHTHSLLFYHRHQQRQFESSFRNKSDSLCIRQITSNASRRIHTTALFAGKEDLELRLQDEDEAEEDEKGEASPPSPQDLQYIQEIKRVLDLLKKNRDMLFNEVKLTVMIEDPREVERRRLLGIEDPDAPTREDLAEALEQVNEGKVPENRVALQLLAEEMMNWPNLEIGEVQFMHQLERECWHDRVEAPRTKPKKSLYAKATDTGIDPQEAAKRLKIDWDSAAEIEDDDNSNDTEVPPVVGYGALYLVSAFPVIIGISVVLILFYNSLQ